MCDQQRLRPACAYAQSDQSLCSSLEYSMIVKLLTEHLLEVLSLKEGCTCSSESTLVKMPHCWKSHVTAHTISTFSHGSTVDELTSKMKYMMKKIQGNYPPPPHLFPPQHHQLRLFSMVNVLKFQTLSLSVLK